MGDRQKLHTPRAPTGPRRIERVPPAELPQGSHRPRTGPRSYDRPRTETPAFSDQRTRTGSRRMASGTGSPAPGGPSAPAVAPPREHAHAHAHLPGAVAHGGPQTVVAFLRDPSLIRFLAQEFRHLEATLRIIYSHAEMTWSLLHDPRAQPRVLLVSVDELSFEELCAIKQVRAAGWRGTTIALSRGRMLPALRGALGIDRLLTPPFVQDVFGDLLRELPPGDD
jgi:hypothetical protein